MEYQFIVTRSPHIHSGDTIQKNMYNVLIALVPAFTAALYLFGLNALILCGLSVLFCVGFEYVITKYILKKKPAILDGSAIITGVLLAFNIPSSLPVWILAVACLFAIGIVKMSFGGLGNNIFNPAIAGRVFLLLLFPDQMTVWPTPYSVDAISSATVLGNLKWHPELLSSLPDMFLGREPGSLGETSTLALLLGFGWLLWRKTITWHIPIAIMATVIFFTGILYIFNPIPLYNPFIHLCSGGLMLGAIFMATDYVTSPMTKKGMLLYGMGIGFITIVIRLWGTYPEGVSFAILLMNAVTPLINFYVKPKRFAVAKKVNHD